MGLAAFCLGISEIASGVVGGKAERGVGFRWAPISLRAARPLVRIGFTQVPQESRCWGAPRALGLLEKQHAGRRADRLCVTAPGSAPPGKALGPAEEPSLLHDRGRH